jgi:hypothetical protein
MNVAILKCKEAELQPVFCPWVLVQEIKAQGVAKQDVDSNFDENV